MLSVRRAQDGVVLRHTVLALAAIIWPTRSDAKAPCGDPRGDRSEGSRHPPRSLTRVPPTQRSSSGVSILGERLTDGSDPRHQGQGRGRTQRSRVEFADARVPDCPQHRHLVDQRSWWQRVRGAPMSSRISALRRAGCGRRVDVRQQGPIAGPTGSLLARIHRSGWLRGVIGVRRAVSGRCEWAARRDCRSAGSRPVAGQRVGGFAGSVVRWLWAGRCAGIGAVRGGVQAAAGSALMAFSAVM